MLHPATNLIQLHVNSRHCTVLYSYILSTLLMLSLGPFTTRQYSKIKTFEFFFLTLNKHLFNTTATKSERFGL